MEESQYMPFIRRCLVATPREFLDMPLGDAENRVRLWFVANNVACIWRYGPLSSDFHETVERRRR
jgi:hypothetical protein